MEPAPKAANIALICLAVFALLWVIARAHVQAVTGDEGVTYTFYVERINSAHWSSEANNHLLNSMLIRLFTSVFGLSHLTVRGGALIGAAIFIAVSLWICKLVGNKWTIQVPLFICLTYNPFMFDFFVAARGYGLATAFLISAFAFSLPWILNPKGANLHSILLLCALSSVSLVLAFSASFPFAFVIFFTLIAILSWALGSVHAIEPAEKWNTRLKLLAACILPGMAVFVILPLYTVLHFSSGELHDGGTSLGETLGSVVKASLFQVNPDIVNPILFPLFTWIRHNVVWAFCLAVVFQLFMVWKNRARLHDPADRRRALLSATLLGIIVLTLCVHLIAFHWFGLLMPRHRLVLWMAPICTILAFLPASISMPSRISRISRGALITVLFVLSGYYLACLRLSYFKEWQYQQDIDKVYEVVAWYNHNRCIKDVEVGWRYHGAMMFYRSMSGRESLAEFSVPDPEYHLNKQLYVLSSAFEGEFIEKQNLKVVYHGRQTDVVVAIRPEFLEPPKEDCSAPPLP